MGKPSKHLLEFMSQHAIDSDEVWEVRAGGAWAIKHSALERIAAEKKIIFDRPAVLESHASEKIAVVCVFGTMGEQTEWSIGEAAPYNNKNTYPFAMAEKRAKDRVTLKLLRAHGVLYSEDEADDFKRENPHVTRPTDIVPDVEYNQFGEPVDNIPNGDPGIERLPKAKSRTEFETLQKQLNSIQTPEVLATWGEKNANLIATLPTDWQAIMRGLYAEHMTELRKGRAA